MMKKMMILLMSSELHSIFYPHPPYGGHNLVMSELTCQNLEFGVPV